VTTRGSLAEAERAFSAARDSAARSGNDRNLYASHSRIGEIQGAQGDLAGELKSYREGLVIMDRLAKSDSDKPKIRATDICLYKTELRVIDFQFAGFGSREVEVEERGWDASCPCPSN
jgi:hypothetical protein